MIRALIAAIKAIILSVFLATILISVAILASLVVIIYGFRIALWPDKRGVADILLNRAVQHLSND